MVSCLNPRKTSRDLLQHVSRPDSPTAVSRHIAYGVHIAYCILSAALSTASSFRICNYPSQALFHSLYMRQLLLVKNQGSWVIYRESKNMLFIWVGKIPWRRERLPTPVFWPGEFHGLYSPWGRKDSDTTEQLSLHHQRDTPIRSEVFNNQRGKK